MLPSAVARTRVKVGVELSGRFASVDEALVAGRIGWEHARVVVTAANPRIVKKMADIQDHLVAAARGTLFERWRREVTGIADLLDEDGGHDPDDGLSRNRLLLSGTFGGSTEVSGRLVGEWGLVARQAIDEMAAELRRAFKADREVCPELVMPDPSTLRALAFVELCRRGLGVDLDATKAPRPDVTLAVNAMTPQSGAVTPDGTVVPDDVSRVLLCDPDLHPIVLDSLGIPVDMGHTVRYATARQRRAIALRDGGCVFPGCGCPAAWTDAHHVEHYTPTEGPTDIDNLAGLCRHHHRVTHRNGWTDDRHHRRLVLVDHPNRRSDLEPTPRHPTRLNDASRARPTARVRVIARCGRGASSTARTRRPAPRSTAARDRSGRTRWFRASTRARRW